MYKNIKVFYKKLLFIIIIFFLITLLLRTIKTSSGNYYDFYINEKRPNDLKIRMCLEINEVS